MVCHYDVTSRTVTGYSKQNSLNKKKKKQINEDFVCMKMCSCSKTALVLSSDWFGEETQEMVCALSRH